MKNIMHKDSLKRLLGPAVLLLAFAVFGLLFHKGLLQQFGFQSTDQAKKILGYFWQIGLWFSAAFFVNRLITVLLWDGIVGHTVKGQIPRLLKDLTAVLVYVIAITGIFKFVFGQPVTGFWATSGVAGIVLGLAVRNMILDLFTGLAVNVDQPFRIGDWIMITDNPGSKDNLIGCVEEVNWRTTRLRTADNNLLVVPNSVLGQKIITNFMHPGERSRFELDFTLDFSVPTERALRVLNAAVQAVVGTPQGPLADKKPSVRITGIDELGVKYRIRYWIIPRLVSPAKARHTVLNSVLQHLRQAGLTLAYPKQDTYVARMPKRQLDTEDLADRRELLSRVRWLKALDESELDSLASAMKQREFSQGQELAREGEPGDSMFLIVEGLAEQFVFSKKRNDEVKVGKLLPGDFIGELSLLTGEPRPVTVRAATDLVVYEISKEHLAPILEARPELAEEISRILAQRHAGNDAALADAETDAPEEVDPTASQRFLEKIKKFFAGVFGV